jgi:DMSO/TMAO reductase YedYZ molybdopterin-dependent catalytic subunit
MALRTRNRKIILFALSLIIALAAFAVSYNFFIEGSASLNSVEIKEYNGENLSSIKDFPDNSIKGPQQIDKETYRLNVIGLVDKNLTYTHNEVLQKYKSYNKVVTLYCVEGWSVKILWEGILLKDLLKDAGIKPGAKVVIFYAYDGYSSSLPLDFIMNNNIIIADKMNGVTLPPERGFPFQLVAESKWGYKWVKWITKIEVSDNVNYKGYWEERGYSNNGDLNASFFAP